MKDYKEFQFGWLIIVLVIPSQILITYFFINNIGDKPFSVAGFIIVSSLLLLTCLFFYGLTTKVAADKITVVFGIGFPRRTIAIDRIKSVEKQIAAIRELSKEEQAEAKREISYNFRCVWFPSDVYFGEYNFMARANFVSATFSARAFFNSATFSADARFDSAKFSGETSFSHATFLTDAKTEAILFVLATDKDGKVTSIQMLGEWFKTQLTDTPTAQKAAETIASLDVYNPYQHDILQVWETTIDDKKISAEIRSELIKLTPSEGFFFGKSNIRNIVESYSNGNEALVKEAAQSRLKDLLKN